MMKYNQKPVIGYMCSYVPYYFIEETGVSVVNFHDLKDKTEDNISKIPVNLCSYVRYCAKILDKAGLDGLVLTNCCNSMQRLYDYVKLSRPNLFCYLLELPRDNSTEECIRFGNDICDLTVKLKSFFHLIKPFPVQKKEFIINKSSPQIFILGNAIPVDIRNLIEHYFENYAIEINDCGKRNNGDILWQRYLDYKHKRDQNFESYTEIPCARMNHYIDWFKQYIKNNNHLKGIVYVSSQNCDHYLFSFPVIQECCESNGIPVIRLEINYNQKGSGQFSTRLEAFAECLDFSKPKSLLKQKVNDINKKNPFTQRMKLVQAIIPTLPLKAIQKTVENQIDIFTNTIWDRPEKIVWTNMVMPPELFYAAGLTPVNMELVAGWLSSLNLSRNYISYSEGKGFSPSVCSYHKATLGLLETGHLCQPRAAAVSSHICDGGVGVVNFFKQRYRTESFILNVPFGKKIANQEYMVTQIRNLVEWIENYTGKKLEEEKIRQALELSNKTRTYWIRTLELRKGQSVVPGRFMLRNLFGATFLFGSQFGYDVVKTYHDEMKEKYKKTEKKGFFEKHKRILWIHFAPLYNNNLLEYLEEELGCYIVFDIT